VVRLLIEAGADVNLKNKYGDTLLHYQTTNERVARVLIKAGANVNLRTYLNQTPLHCQRDEGFMKVLIEAGVDVNAKNYLGNTSLLFQNDKRVIRLLIESGANVNEINNYGNIFVCRRIVGIVVKDMASEKITRFIRNCKWLKLYRLTRTFAFNKWYCGEDDGNGGGTGRKVDHKRIMDAVGGRMK